MSTIATTASGLSYAAISTYAEEIGEHHAIYKDDGWADIDRLIAALGGQVEIADSGESLHVRTKRDFTIFVPFTTSSRRDRFTKAHELGHYFLHYLLPKYRGERRYDRGSRSRAETEANVFAASLLMPESKFRAAHRRSGDPWKLAGIFEVSPAAADVRAQVLRLDR